MKRHPQFKLQVNLCAYENIKTEGHKWASFRALCVWTQPLLYVYNQNQQISASLTPLSILKPLPNLCHPCPSQVNDYSLLSDRGQGQKWTSNNRLSTWKEKCIQKKSLDNILSKLSKYSQGWTVDNYSIVEGEYLLLFHKGLLLLWAGHVHTPCYFISHVLRLVFFCSIGLFFFNILKYCVEC